MKVRFTDKPHITGISGRFNVVALAEVIVGFDNDMGADTCYIKDLDVLIGEEWITMHQAFKNHDLITDNYNTYFFEPKTPEDRERGYIG